jgi:hypothetical protein
MRWRVVRVEGLSMLPTLGPGDRLESDNQRAPGRRDSWDFGAVPEQDVLGRVVLRYWPPSRLPQRSEQ